MNLWFIHYYHETDIQNQLYITNISQISNTYIQSAFKSLHSEKKNAIAKIHMILEKILLGSQGNSLSSSHFFFFFFYIILLSILVSLFLCLVRLAGYNTAQNLWPDKNEILMHICIFPSLIQKPVENEKFHLRNKLIATLIISGYRSQATSVMQICLYVFWIRIAVNSNHICS